eukprot:CAMPEP_0184301870 /NCGR_PEP_ID=MMETSP1049-20130417/11982_1 /TAXON_ID=77928 /ORGANISM="Proteomonas sulcata, Strain CCMP704" /LENGTH=238 /DNA_ID=CAMNT_0026612997 /DNA_START=18 /DNA_END=734 /DNA_ORIENTATION=+
MKSVHFPTVLDLTPYCTRQLREPIDLRTAQRKEDYMAAHPIWENHDQDDELESKWAQAEKEDYLEEQRQRLAAKQQVDLASGLDIDLGGDPEEKEMQQKMAEDEKQLNDELQKKIEKKQAAMTGEARDRLDEEASRIKDSGTYQLRGVICHQGRYADAGHYITFAKTDITKKTSGKGLPHPMWWKFDDDTVTLVTEDDVKRTAGGADGPISYILLYAKSEEFTESMKPMHAKASADQW